MSQSHQKGFTLLELVVVLVVIALAIAISYPSLSRGTSALHLRSVGRDVLNSLRYARERAITEQTVMRVTVNKGERKITLTDDYGEGSAPLFCLTTSGSRAWSWRDRRSGKDRW